MPPSVPPSPEESTRRAPAIERARSEYGSVNLALLAFVAVAVFAAIVLSI